MTNDRTTLQLRPIVHAILDEYTLPVNGQHGLVHWARVLENGLRLAEETGANVEVVQLFALFHDSKRINECTDPDHGQRGADFAAELRGNIFDLPDHEFNLLHRACVGHTHERTHPDVTIQTCWDSDPWSSGDHAASKSPVYRRGEEERNDTVGGWAGELWRRARICGYGVGSGVGRWLLKGTFSHAP